MADNSSKPSREPPLTDTLSSDIIYATNRNAVSTLVSTPTLESVMYQMICSKVFLYPVCELCLQKIAKDVAEECGADINVDYCISTESVASMRRESVASMRRESVASMRRESVASMRRESVASMRRESVASMRRESVASMRRESVSKYGVLMVELLVRRRAIVWDTNQDISCIHFLHKTKRYLLLYIRMLNDAIGNNLHLDPPMLRGDAFFGIISRYECQDFGQIEGKIEFLKAAAAGDIERMKYVIGKEDLPDYENALYLAILNGQVDVETFLINNEPINLKDYVKELELCGARLIIFWAEKEKGLECWRKSLQIRRDFRIGFWDKINTKTKMDLGVEFKTNTDINLLRDDWDCFIQGLLIFLRHLSSSSTLTQRAFEVVAENYPSNNDLRPLKVLSVLYRFPHSHTRPPSKRALHAMEKLFHQRFARYIEDKAEFLKRFRTLFKQLHYRIWNDILAVTDEFYRAAYEELLALVVMNIDYMSAYDLNIEERKSIGKEIRKLTETPTTAHATTLLHKAIKMKSALPIVSFIIDHTNDVNCSDSTNCTPLHVVSHFNKFDPYLHYIANVLMNAGGHIDCIDSNGERPQEELKRKGVIHNPLDNLSLQCLAAEVISKSKISVSEKTFPRILVRFIRLHSTCRY